jgi:FkbM family methyltransferase
MDTPQEALAARFVALDRSDVRRFARAHALARWSVQLPMPLFWLANVLVCRWLAPPLVGRQRCRTALGFDLIVRPSNGGVYFRCGFYELGTLHVIASCLRRGDTFIDAGASVGQMAFHAARAVGPTGRVLAFEPAPERYEDLVAGVAVNRLDHVAALPCGLGAEDGELGLYLRGSPSMADQTRTEDVVRVPVRRLDEVLRVQRIERVRFLKIDVEGLEPEVLMGARELLASPEPPIVCYEHGIYRHSTAVPDLLPRDYVLYQLAGTAHRVSRLVPADARKLRADNVFAIPKSQLPTLPRELFSP